MPSVVNFLFELDAEDAGGWWGQVRKGLGKWIGGSALQHDIDVGNKMARTQGLLQGLRKGIQRGMQQGVNNALNDPNKVGSLAMRANARVIGNAVRNAGDWAARNQGFVKGAALVGAGAGAAYYMNRRRQPQ